MPDLFGTEIIDFFKGEYDFLSNFYKAPLTLWGTKFPTSEHAYQWIKTTDVVEQARVLWTTKEVGGPLVPTTAGESKTEGGRVTLRADWDEICYGYMLEILLAKFSQNIELAEKLVATNDAILIEGNYWHDNRWGDCRCGKRDKCKAPGQNMLGKALMEVRETLRDLCK